MKKKYVNKVRLIITILLLSHSAFVLSLDGKGKIEEVMSCGAGISENRGWKQVLLFKLSDGNWFGVFSDYKGVDWDMDSNFATSLVLMAFSSNLPVEVKANHRMATYCGKTTAMYWDKANDFIKINK